jgi:predicted transcriptional regulator
MSSAAYTISRSRRRKRNRYEVLAALVKSSKGGARKTNLMFQANLSFVLLNKYLSFLLERGFIENRDGLFFPTHAGLVYLKRVSRYLAARDSLARTEEKVQSSLTMSKETVFAR